MHGKTTTLVWLCKVLSHNISVFRLENGREQKGTQGQRFVDANRCIYKGHASNQVDIFILSLGLACLASARASPNFLAKAFRLAFGLELRLGKL